MRSPQTPKLHLPSRGLEICRFTSQPYVRDVRQRRTFLALYDLLGDPSGSPFSKTLMATLNVPG